jgi:hypothetical protein
MNSQQPIGLNLLRKVLIITVVVILLNYIVACKTAQINATPSIAHQQASTTPVNTNLFLTPPISTPTVLAKNDSTCWLAKDLGHRSPIGSLLYTYILMDPITGSPTASGTAAFNLRTSQTTGLKNFPSHDISSDGKILAEFTDANWAFMAESGNTAYPIPDIALQSDSTYMFLPNNQILLEGPSLNQSNNLGGDVSRDIFVFAPDTGKLTFIQSVLMPYSLRDPSSPRNDYQVGLFSPDLNYVIYPANYQGANISILLNIQNQNIVWYGWPDSDLGFYRPPLPYYNIEQPIWMPDSGSVIFHRIDKKTGAQNLFSISVDGQVSQLTHLEELFPANEYVISSLSISPNGQYLAFAIVQDFQAYPVRKSLLLILDLKNGTIIQPCITLANSPLPASPVWSPDSSMLAIFPDAGNSILAVDLIEREFFSLLSKTGLDPGSLIGWIDWGIP